MKKNLIKYSVSVAEYDRNKNEKDTYKIKWTEKEGTTETLINDIKNNRAFCPCFYHSNNTFTNKDKSDTNLKSTHFIIFDMDAVKLTASDFYTIMQSTEIPPTIVYTTANNGKFKTNKNEEYNNRYRVIYLLDTPIVNASYYKEIHQALKSEICVTIDDNNIYNDNSDSSVSHFFAGCRGGELYSNDNVISLQWLRERYNINAEVKKVQDRYINKEDKGGRYRYIISNTHDNNEGGQDRYIISHNYDDKKVSDGYIYSARNSNKCESVHNNLYNITEDKDLKRTGKYVHYYFKKELEKVSDGYISKKREEVLYNDVILLNELDNSEFINDFYLMDVDDIIRKYISTFPSYEHTQVEINDDELYYILPNDYVEIRRFWYIDRVENDEGREFKSTRIRKIKNGEGRRRKLFINLILRRLITPTLSFENLLFNAVYELHNFINNTDKSDIITKIDIVKIVTSAYFADLTKWENLRKSTKRPRYKINKEFCIKHNLNARREALKINAENKRKAKKERDKKIAEYYNINMTDKENLQILNENDITISLITLKRWKKENGFTKKKNKNAHKAIESVKSKEVAQLPTNDKKASQGANVAIVEVNKESAQNYIKVMLDGTMREITINDLRSELFGGSLLTLTNNIIGVRAYELSDDLRFTMSVINSDLKPSLITTNKKDDVICFYALDSELNDNEYKTLSYEICNDLKTCINEFANERIVSLVNGYDFERGENFGCINNEIIYNTQWLINRYSIKTESNEIVRDGYIISQDDDEVNNYSPTYFNNDFWSNKDVLI